MKNRYKKYKKLMLIINIKKLQELMESKFLYIPDKNGELRVKYTNLYYIENEFYFFTLNKEITLKRVLENKYDYFLPKIKVVDNLADIDRFIIDKNINIVENPTCYLSHYYDWNVGHGLYDSLYPIYYLYLLYLQEEKKYEDNKIFNGLFNIFIKFKFIEGWRFPGIASRDWVLDIFKKFCKGKFIEENRENQFTKNNYLIKEFLCGNAFSGISSVNKEFEMPGRELKGLEKFRDRILKIYEIPKKISSISKRLKITFIRCDRYNNDDIYAIDKIIDELKFKHEVKLISWNEYSNFKEQLELMNETDILVTGSGTSMMNFPFLRNGSILVNLGTNEVGDEYKVPSLMEVNICLLADYIKVNFYDIFNHKKIKLKELSLIIERSINEFTENINKATELPDFIRIWRLYFKLDDKNSDILIEKMNGIRQPHLMGYRWPEILVNECKPFNNNSKLINNQLLQSIKIYPKNIFQIYHDKSLVSNNVKQQIERLNPEYSYRIIDFEEGKEIIRNNLDEILAKRICSSLDKMPRYCHRSDLLRYCLLYIYGGIYLDVDLKPLQSFDKIIRQDTDLITCFGSGGDKVDGFEFEDRNKKLQQIMANGLFASKKGNILLLDLIEYSVNNIHKPDILNHGNNVRWLFKYLENKCNSTNQQIQPFKNLNIDNYIVYLYYEDKRNNNHYMVDKNFDIIVDPGDPNYIFPKQ